MHSTDIASVFPAQVGQDEVCLWWASLDQVACDGDRLEQHLSSDEEERASRFVFERDRKRYVAGRAFLRMILGHFLAVPPIEVSFRYGRHEKPFLDDTDLSFNMSKSAGCAIYAVTRGRRIGVDLEHLREIDEIEAIARHFFSETEYRFLRALPENMQQKTFFAYWTRKEALVKAAGAGLTIPLDSFDVSVNQDDPVRMVRLGNGLGGECSWTLCDLEQYPGFAVALAVESPDALPLRTYVFPSIDGT